MKKDVIVIGGGAAGFFTALNVAEKHPEYQVIILEKTNKLLSKVKVSGGGRCNVTNQRDKPSELIPFYPRGQKKLYNLFQQFTTTDMVSWLAKKGVNTHAEADQRIFPSTNSSQTIIDCFVNEARKHKINIIQNCALEKLIQENEVWTLMTSQGEFKADKVVIATGASPSLWKTLRNLGLGITSPVPSLFTFNIKDPRIEGLQGVAFEEVKARVTGTKLEEVGPLLITHWGLSGPVILKLSAWGARELADLAYNFEILVSYLPGQTFDGLHQFLQKERTENLKRKLVNHPIKGLPKRFWTQLCKYCGIKDQTTYGELSKKQINKLTEELTQGRYKVTGKSTFKEEFVTSGGVKLSEIDLKTFEAKRFRNLYLAGEVLDIDALTGGFNFQACWSAGWVISENI